jgi:hypothetical protein
LAITKLSGNRVKNKYFKITPKYGYNNTNHMQQFR